MMNEEYVTLALPKGRLLAPSLCVLRSLGIPSDALDEIDRRLCVFDRDSGFRYLLVRPSDVVTYVSEGAADLGIVGKDTLLETPGSVYELYDLGFGRCHLAVAAEKEMAKQHCDNPGNLYRSRGLPLRIATKYPRTTEKHFRTYGLDTHIIALRGSIELAPLVGLADVIVDLVSSGRTLKANQLAEVEFLADVTARLIANPVSLKVHRRMGTLLEPLRRTAEAGKDEPGC